MISRSEKAADSYRAFRKDNFASFLTGAKPSVIQMENFYRSVTTTMHSHNLPIVRLPDLQHSNQGDPQDQPMNH